MPERLVILEAAAAAPLRSAIEQVAPVRHSGSGRVFTVIGDDAALRRIQQMPGVQQVLIGDEREEQLPALDASDSLFARAWLLGRQPKSRPGEGLAWDTPGFLPPGAKK